MDSCGGALIGMVEGNGRERIRRVMWMVIIRFRCMIILGIVRGMRMMGLGFIPINPPGYIVNCGTEMLSWELYMISSNFTI